jgi:hypothetical protein
MLCPHGREAIRDVVAHVSGLAGLEVQPVSVLMLVIAVVRPVVNSSGLSVPVPRLDFQPAGLHLGLGAGTVTAG